MCKIKPEAEEQQRPVQKAPAEAAAANLQRDNKHLDAAQDACLPGNENVSARYDVYKRNHLWLLPDPQIARKGQPADFYILLIT